MQETTIYCKTCGLYEHNCVELTKEIRRWIPQASVYIQNHPCRVIVCRGILATVINEGDVFSFVQRKMGEQSMSYDIVNHSEKLNTVKVTIGDNDFLIETFDAPTDDGSDKIKFRLTCLFNPKLSEEFDDYASVSNRISNYLWDSVSKKLRLTI